MACIALYCRWFNNNIVPFLAFLVLRFNVYYGVYAYVSVITCCPLPRFNQLCRSWLLAFALALPQPRINHCSRDAFCRRTHCHRIALFVYRNLQPACLPTPSSHRFPFLAICAGCFAADRSLFQFAASALTIAVVLPYFLMLFP